MLGFDRLGVRQHVGVEQWWHGPEVIAHVRVAQRQQIGGARLAERRLFSLSAGFLNTLGEGLLLQQVGFNRLDCFGEHGGTGVDCPALVQDVSLELLALLLDGDARGFQCESAFPRQFHLPNLRGVGDFDRACQRQPFLCFEEEWRKGDFQGGLVFN